MGARGLLDLPAEVQLNTYSYLLPSSVISPFKGSGDFMTHQGHDKIALKAVLALLQVHSACYKNAIVQLYALNTFMLFSATDAAHWHFRFGRPRDMEGFKGRLVHRSSFLFLVSKELPPCFE